MWQFLKDAFGIIGLGVGLLAITWGGTFWAFPEANLTGYTRLGNAECHSLICGTSLSAHGVAPEFLNTTTEAGIWMNYSFSLKTSPWNEVYVRSIEEKLACSVRQFPGQFFLLFVDPWNVRKSDRESMLEDPEVKPCSTSPMHYLLHHSDPLGLWKQVYSDPVVNWLGKPFGVYRPHVRVAPSGWIRAEPIPDESAIARRTKKKLNQYISLPDQDVWPDPASEAALMRMIDTMHSQYPHATVVMVRPPVSPEFLALEEERYPDADQQFERWAQQKGVAYWNYSRAEGIDSKHFWDGHHLDEVGAKAFTSQLAQRIRRASEDEKRH